MFKFWLIIVLAGNPEHPRLVLLEIYDSMSECKTALRSINENATKEELEAGKPGCIVVAKPTRGET